jgi:adenylosuccinate lyase
MQAWDEGLSFRDLLAVDPRVAAFLTPHQLDDLFDIEYHLRYIDTAYERLGIGRGN